MRRREFIAGLGGVAAGGARAVCEVAHDRISWRNYGLSPESLEHRFCPKVTRTRMD